MKAMWKKELCLTMHPTAPLFLALSAMVLIPNYPYGVLFFYTGLGIFFICLQGRENGDVPYTLQLPVSRRQVVQGRMLCSLVLQGAQLLLCALFILLRGILPLGANLVGLDANLALLGLGFLLYGVWNAVFFPRYYRSVQKVGIPFVVASAAQFLVIAAVETCCHTVFLFRDRLDTPDPQFLPEKAAFLAVCAVLFAGLTFWAYRKAVRGFEALDL